jgi:Mn-dependent DtxR family transcriptional regulator
MTDIAKKVKEKLEDVKDKAMGTEHAAREKTEDHTSDIVSDPTKEYDSKEPMSPAKIKEHDPTVVRRESTTNTSLPTSEADAKERLRRSGMTEGTAGST